MPQVLAPAFIDLTIDLTDTYPRVEKAGVMIAGIPLGSSWSKHDKLSHVLPHEHFHGDMKRKMKNECVQKDAKVLE